MTASLRRLLVTAGTAALAVAAAPVTSAVAHPAAAPHYKNCTALNKAYKHGVGKPGARDHVSGRSKPVTTFTRNAKVYAANTGLDRDRDGIACEKR